jgi:hypothetical protein
MKVGFINRRPMGSCCFCLTSRNLHIQLISVSILLFAAVCACAENVDPNETGNVDMAGFSIFASWWQNYYPDGWILK